MKSKGLKTEPCGSPLNSLYRIDSSVLTRRKRWDTLMQGVHLYANNISKLRNVVSQHHSNVSSASQDQNQDKTKPA